MWSFRRLSIWSESRKLRLRSFSVPRRDQMNSHKNAPLTPKGREAMVRSVTEGGLSQAAAARQFNITPKIVAKWVNRFHAEGVEGLRDRSSRPHSLPSQTEPATCAMVEALRRQRHTGKQIATELKILPDEKAESAVSFLKAAVAYYKSLGVTVTRVMTDNGSCYKAFDFRDACQEIGLKHKRTKPYTPKTNGKAERFIQTALREWAYAQAYPTSDRRAEELPFWLHRYNWHRPHGGIKSQTPISRLALSENNLLRLHT